MLCRTGAGGKAFAARDSYVCLQLWLTTKLLFPVVLSRTVNDVKGLVKHFHMVQTQLEQISNVQKDFLANNAKKYDMQAYGIKVRGGTHTQDPLYPEGHPNRIEQDSQLQGEDV